MSIGPWQPLWIGEPDRQLYAALHRPAAAEATHGVLLVPPLLHEQQRSRRFITEVASALAAQGVAALRFDFFGSGDSAGANEAMSLTTMHEDLQRACDALRSHSGVSIVAVLAWRAGALVAWDWLRHGGTASELLLWEPIRDGREWLDDLQRADVIERCSPDRYTGQCPSIADASDGQLMGYAVSTALRQAMAELSMTEATAPAIPIWLIERSGLLERAPLWLAPLRTSMLPDDAPHFGGSTRMDESFFMSPQMEQWTNDLARTLAGSD